MKIPLAQPYIGEEEINEVLSVLKTPILSIGPKLEEFEKLVAQYVGAKYAIAVNSGTSALHLCIRSFDIKDGDEVITTPFSFIASANCILFERAKPVFVDIEPDTLCIDPAKIEEKITERTKAILPVHVFGHPANMEAINKIAEKYNLVVIEDACEAIGAEIKGRKVGTFGNAATFAFYPNKQITTGEGGVIVTDDDRVAELCRSMRSQGRAVDGGWLYHERLGYNYRMPELSAALGVAQMRRLAEILRMRQRVAELYNERLKEIPGLQLPYQDPVVKVSWFVYVIRLAHPINRDKVITHLTEAGIGCKPYFPAIHLQPFYLKRFGYKKGDFPVTEQVASQTVALPFYTAMTEKEIDYVGTKLEEIIRTLINT